MFSILHIHTTPIIHTLIKPLPTQELSIPLLEHLLRQQIQHPPLREYSMHESSLSFFMLFEDVGDAGEHWLEDWGVVDALQEEEDRYGEGVQG